MEPAAERERDGITDAYTRVNSFRLARRAISVPGGRWRWLPV